MADKRRCSAVASSNCGAKAWDGEARKRIKVKKSEMPSPDLLGEKLRVLRSSEMGGRKRRATRTLDLANMCFGVREGSSSRSVGNGFFGQRACRSLASAAEKRPGAGLAWPSWLEQALTRCWHGRGFPFPSVSDSAERCSATLGEPYRRLTGDVPTVTAPEPAM